MNINQCTHTHAIFQTHTGVRELNPDVGVDVLGVLHVEVDAPHHRYFTVRVVEVRVAPVGGRE